ncbi:MAG: Shikimate dehydrogenase (NADP(+)) [Candidatus Dichloromethanomonas elyunquensis]|nr:MAG: Shikimate dehydrogenase (NADP(+)) [Candidatus Dichloromethanomonas elyunquensis]
MKFAIIGDPVDHSLSPQMHEAGFKAVGLDAVYQRIPVKNSEIGQGVRYLLDNRYDGWNVTYPLKEAIIPLLDRVTPEALDIGAVNTVKRVDGYLLGHNTDGEGFVQSLITKGFEFSGKKAVILGAGGAAKAIAMTLAKKGLDILILNRNVEKARWLAGQVSGCGGKASWGCLGIGDWLQKADLLIQTTPVGMKGEEYLFGLRGISPSTWVVDIIYHPAVTAFLGDAAKNGCQTMNGLDMLLYQGVLAWEFWLNRDAPVSFMQRALTEGLRSSDECDCANE